MRKYANIIVNERLKEMQILVRKHSALATILGGIASVLLLTIIFLCVQEITEKSAYSRRSIGKTVEQTREELNAVKEYLTALDQDMVSHHDVLSEFSKEYLQVEHTTDTIRKLLTTLSDNQFTANELLTQNIVGLDGRFQSVHGEISRVLTLISQVEQSMSSQTGYLDGILIEQMEQIRKAFADVNGSYLQVTEQTTTLIGQLGNQVEKEYQALSKRLEEMEMASAKQSAESSALLQSRLDALMAQSDEQATQTDGLIEKMKQLLLEKMEGAGAIIDSQNQTIGNQQESINSQNQTIGNQQESINSQTQTIGQQQESINSQSQTIGNQQESINSQTQTIGHQQESINSQTQTIGQQQESINSQTETIKNQQLTIQNQNVLLNEGLYNHFSDLEGKMNQRFEEVKARLAEVFQSVSSGKRILASALLTKGVSCRQDATFQELYQAICNIPQTIVIGQTQLPGEIVYTYHYHVDGSDTQLHTEECLTSGGCYTNAVFHVHSGSSESGGGCYTNTAEGQRYCGEWECYSNVGSTQKFRCSGCGKEAVQYGEISGPGWGMGDHFKSYTYYTLGCNKQAQSVDKYTPACGYIDGQIIEAHISYAGQ